MSAQSAMQPCNKVNLLFYSKRCLCSKLFLCSSVPVLLMSVTAFIRDQTDFPWFVAGKQHIRTFVARRLSQDYQDIGTCYLINRPCSLFPVSPQQFTCFCSGRVHALIAFLLSSLTGKEEILKSWCTQDQWIGLGTATENCYELWWWQRVMWQPLPNHGNYNKRSVAILKMPTATVKPQPEVLSTLFTS